MAMPRFRLHRAWLLVASLAAAPLAAQDLGRQSSECFVIYRLAAGVSGNAAHRGDFERLGQLMGRTMDDEGVTKAQFDRWMGGLMSRIGTPQKPDHAAISSKIDACNRLAQQRHRYYTGSR